MKSLLTFFLLLVAATAAPKRSLLSFRNLYKPIVNLKPRIIGGQEALPHSFPYQAFLVFNSHNTAWFCGGALISQNYVLTSAACGWGSAQAEVTLGAHNPFEVEDTQITLTSTQIRTHELYDIEEFINDIAIVTLPLSVPLSSAIQVVPLTIDISNNFVGASATVTGWGLTDGRGTTISNGLNFVEVTVMTNADCETFLGFLPLSTLCTSGTDNGGICSGDVGGPLVSEGTLIGVASWGVPYCVEGFPSAFTRVTSFLDWIGRYTDVKIL